MNIQMLCTFILGGIAGGTMAGIILHVRAMVRSRWRRLACDGVALLVIVGGLAVLWFQPF